MMALPALASAIGIGGAAAGAATAATTLGTISTGLSIAGSIAGVATSLNQASYQAGVARNNEKIAKDNAALSIVNAQKENQQRGLAAAAEMGDLLSSQASSGLSLGSGSYALARKSQALLAQKDSSIVAEEGSSRATNYLQSAGDAAADAAGAKASAGFSLFSGALGIGTSAISGAAKVSKSTARKYY